ncbi:MAG: hypothetical protein AAGF23_10135 [Acidobacteriota bacterium]
MREWIDAECPDVQLAVTEYRWGEDDGPSSAIAHAEVLAVFGREGVDLATRWVAPEPGSKVEDAFELFLDYDGAGSAVQGDSVRATSDRPDDLGTYAVADDGGKLWLVLINRSTASLGAQVAVVGGAAPGTASFYRFDAANPLALGGAVAVSAGPTALSLELPARSVTLVEAGVPAGSIFADGFESGDTSAWSAEIP